MNMEQVTPTALIAQPTLMVRGCRFMAMMMADFSLGLVLKF
jgi:hypothetical protein